MICRRKRGRLLRPRRRSYSKGNVTGFRRRRLSGMVLIMLDKPQLEVDPRIYLAAERTFLAWIRTGLAFMGFGFVVARFGLFMRELMLEKPSLNVHSSGVSMPVGVTLISMGIVITAAAAARHRRYIQAIDRGHFRPAFGSLFGVCIAGLLLLMGLVMVVYLIAL